MQFYGYQDSPSGKEIRMRQQSCLIRDLPEDEVPDFWKANLERAKDAPKANRMTIKEIVFKVLN
jgi:hypothetical protein